MKTSFKKGLSMILAAAMCISMFSVSALAADTKDINAGSSVSGETGSVTLNKTDLNLRMDGEETLTAAVSGSVNPSDLIWKSSDESIVKVDGGKLTPVKLGCTTVSVESASDASIKAECRVTVSYGLPMFYVDLDNGKQIGDIQKGYDLPATIEIEAGGLYSKDVNLEKTPMVIAGRGNSTWNAPKKPFKFEFDSKTKVLDYKKAKKWVLLANYYDVSQIRNYMVMYAAQYFTNAGFAPRGTFVDLFVNGNYNGVYLLCEQVQIAENRVDIAKPDPSIVDGSYLFEIDEYGDSDERYFYPNYMTYSNNYWNQNLPSKVNIKKPKMDEITEEQFQFAKDYVNQADEAVMNGNYEDYIDVDSLIDWYLLQEFMKNKDSDFYKSCYMYKSAGGKLIMGPIWDFDLTGDNGRFGHWMPWNVCSSEGFCMQESSWMRTLFSYPKFEQQVKDRWAELRNNGAIDKFIEAIDVAYETLGYSIYRDNDKWHTIGTNPMFGSPTFPTYDAEVAHLREWHVQRIAWLDEAFDYSGPVDTDGWITSEELTVDRDHKLIKGLEIGASADELLSKVSSSEGAQIKVLNADGSDFAGGRLKTGMKLQSVKNGEVKDELDIVVRADVNGDGRVNIYDLLETKYMILNEFVSDEKPYSAYYEAANMTGSDKLSIFDLVAMKLVVMGR